MISALQCGNYLDHCREVIKGDPEEAAFGSTLKLPLG